MEWQLRFLGVRMFVWGILFGFMRSQCNASEKRRVLFLTVEQVTWRWRRTPRR